MSTFARNAANAYFRRALLFGTVAATGSGLHASPTLGAEVQLEQSITVSQDFTDNVNVTPDDKRLDSITGFALAYDIIVDTRRLDVNIESESSYQKVLRDPNLDATSFVIDGDADISLIERAVTLQGRLNIEDIFADSAVTPASDRLLERNQTTLVSYRYGPLLQFSLFDRVETILAGRISEVDFRDVDPSITEIVPEDTTIHQAGASISNAPFVNKLQQTIAGEYFEQDTGFELYYGLYTLGWNVHRGLRLSGSVGYEEIFEEGITDINGLVWLGGVALQPNATSLLDLTYGYRYGDSIASGLLSYRLRPRILLTAQYNERLETAQSRLERTVTDLTAFGGDLTEDNAQLAEVVFPNLIDATIRSRDFSAVITVNFEPVYPWQSSQILIGSTMLLDIEYTHSELEAVDDGSAQVSDNVRVALQRPINNRLSMRTAFSYENVTDEFGLEPSSASYQAEIEMDWAIDRQTSVTFGWTTELTSLEDSDDILENVLSLSLTRSF